MEKREAMEKVKLKKHKESIPKNQAENYGRLDKNYSLDNNTVLVKEKYGKMDARGAMDQGIMLK